MHDFISKIEKGNTLGMDSGVCLYIFVNGLHPRLREFVLSQNPNSFDKATELALLKERLLAEMDVGVIESPVSMPYRVNNIESSLQKMVSLTEAAQGDVATGDVQLKSELAKISSTMANMMSFMKEMNVNNDNNRRNANPPNNNNSSRNLNANDNNNNSNRPLNRNINAGGRSDASSGGPNNNRRFPPRDPSKNCTRCSMNGHISENCIRRQCENCNGFGHTSARCQQFARENNQNLPADGFPPADTRVSFAGLGGQLNNLINVIEGSDLYDIQEDDFINRLVSDEQSLYHDLFYQKFLEENFNEFFQSPELVPELDCISVISNDKIFYQPVHIANIAHSVINTTPWAI